MNDHSSARSVAEVSARLEHYLIPVPSGGENVCAVCHSAVYDGYRTCYQCNEARRTLSDLRLDAVGFVSLAPAGEQLARDLFTYKRSNVPEQQRRERTVGLSAVLWRWLAQHERCLERQVGRSGFDLVTTVPSASGRVTEHPLATLVGGVVRGTQDRVRSVLNLNRTDVPSREQAPDRFTSTLDIRGLDVLVIDDTWTTGANIQSASAALKRPGANTVAGVAIGRWFRADYRNNSTWLNDAKSPRWSWDTCCLE